MEVRPLGGCGATVDGLALAGAEGEGIEALRRALATHGLLVFRDQALSPDDHLAFARRFGEIVVNKFFPVDGLHPEIAEVRKEKEQKTNIGGGWHADHSYDAEPALGSILVARELPSAGGDTHFANLADAYDTLSDGFKEMLGSLRAVHSNRHLYGAQGIYRKTDLADQLGGEDQAGDAVHPVVIRHPETGRSVLYVNPGHTTQIEGWSLPESRALLDFLFAHVTKSGSTTSLQWKPGSIAIWDNRQTWHLADNDYHGERRLMHRITLAGESLQAASEAAQ